MFAEKTRFVILNLFEMLLFKLKRKFLFILYCLFVVLLSQKRFLTFLLSSVAFL